MSYISSLWLDSDIRLIILFVSFIGIIYERKIGIAWF